MMTAEGMGGERKKSALARIPAIPPLHHESTLVGGVAWGPRVTLMCAWAWPADIQATGAGGLYGTSTPATNMLLRTPENGLGCEARKREYWWRADPSN